jgi:hypothetical protein
MNLLLYLAYVLCVMMFFQQGTIFFSAILAQYCLISFQRSSFIFVHYSDNSSMNNPTKTTYMASFPKRNNFTGTPNQVFKFDNLLNSLLGGINSNTIAAIETINPVSLCVRYLFAPQIHYNLDISQISVRYEYVLLARPAKARR